jgi:dethiobiotin synthetase/adenosylmethionine--8-amino-7-oxononanoate aminotransferase
MTPDPEVSYEFASIRHVLDVEARLMMGTKSLKSLYKEMIEMQWLAHEHSTQHKIGSVLLEPLLLATGGMKFVDPLWQRALLEVAQSRHIPVLWDETTVGLYRLGVSSCAREILQVAEPDVIVVSKLLTGGVIPSALSAVITTEEVFDAVVGGEVGQSLANSNTVAANPVACVSALQALAAYRILEEEEKDTMRTSRRLWKGPRLLFEEESTRALSELPWVEESFTLGSVLTVKLHSRKDNTNENERDDDESDDERFSRANLVVKELKAKGVLAQPFGDVVYIMSSPLAPKEECTKILNILHGVIDWLSKDESCS